MGNETVMNSKMTAINRQRQLASETKAEKQASRQQNLHQRAMEEQRAQNMKNMIQG